MKLKDWQKKENVSDVEVAERAGIHPSYICHINAGRKIPTPKIALMIELATGGAVKKEELIWPD